ncbi:MAG: hypothetical protein PHV28_14780 [Kiritimatiellae bacterium]|nr:hypothetical protein [Kiritimatiellia bacterium]
MLKAAMCMPLVAAVGICFSPAGMCRAETVTADIATTTESWLWQTLSTNTVPLALNWPNGATSAQLVISGMNCATQTVALTPAESNYMWTAFSTAAPAQEEVYELRLTYYEQSAVSAVYTARLAAVSGAFGADTVKADTASRAWRKIRNDAVIPYSALWDATTTAATNVQMAIAGPARSETLFFDNKLGYYGLKLLNLGWGFGTFDLTLSFLGTGVTRNATLFRSEDGVLLSLQ